MVDADVDIYGDLCDEKPAVHLEQAQLQLPAAVPAAVPAAAPPAAALPRPSPEGGSGQWPAEQEFPPPAWEEWDFNEGVVVEKGEVVKAGEDGKKARGQRAEKPEDFESLQKELLADEAAPSKKSLVRQGSTAAASTEGAPSGSDTEPENASPVSGSGDEAEDGLVQLDEIRASESRAIVFPRRWGGKPPAGVAGAGAGAAGGGDAAGSGRFRRRETSLFIGPPPPQLAATFGGPECLLLVGGLPWWLSDAALRRQVEQFGQVRMIRMLDHPRSGKSLGVALVEYLAAEAAQKAAGAAEGLCSLSSWATMPEARPRVVLVSPELYLKLRSGVLPWPDGGPCSEELRAILVRQFDLSHIARVQAAPRGGRPPTGSPSRAPHRASSGGGASAGGGGSPDMDRPRRDEGNWADKLKKLQANVNRRQSSSELLADPGPAQKRRR